jgi:hypothetical protein
VTAFTVGQAKFPLAPKEAVNLTHCRWRFGVLIGSPLLIVGDLP